MTEQALNLSVTDLQSYVVPTLSISNPPPSFRLPFEKKCRICYEGESSYNSLISPCKCAGSAKYVHEECLKTWIVARAEDLSNGSCEQCKAEYIMDIEITTTCRFGSILFSKQALMFWLLLTFLFGLIASICAISSVQSNDSKAKSYLIVLLVACCISLVVVSFLLYVSARRIFCYQSMTDWKVKDYNSNYAEIVPQRNDLTLFDEVDNSAYNAKNYDQSTLILIPESIIVRGYQIPTPVLKPSLQDITAQAQGMKAFATRSLASSLAPSMNPSPRNAETFNRL